MPGKGFPSSPFGLRRDKGKKGVEFRLRRRLRRDKLRRGKRTDPAKGLFPLLKYRPLLGTEPNEKKRIRERLLE